MDFSEFVTKLYPGYSRYRYLWLGLRSEHVPFSGFEPRTEPKIWLWFGSDSVLIYM